MNLPRPTDHHRKLEALVGSWTAEVKHFPSPWDPKGGTATGTLEARIAVDGHFLVSDYVEERGGQVAFRGHGVYGYDEKTDRYSMHWFDSVGGPGPERPVRGRWVGSVLTFEGESPAARVRYVYELGAPGRYTFRIESSRDGGAFAPFMEARFTRR